VANFFLALLLLGRFKTPCHGILKNAYKLFVALCNALSRFLTDVTKVVTLKCSILSRFGHGNRSKADRVLYIYLLKILLTIKSNIVYHNSIIVICFGEREK
jgi:hypothetical protein